MNKSLEFLELVEEAMARKRKGMGYLPAALKASLRIPDSVPVAEAAAIFIRWICREPAGEEPDAAITPPQNSVGVSLPVSPENNTVEGLNGHGTGTAGPVGGSPIC
jgi:hypothetical protein